ncbi:MAG: S41 family peptidase [Planctomycetota bacterium]|nr:S41 family peptidase [Planctomycetota bacterium]MDA1212596.1 S41 family peptidase [Planctomycetota bacterium]
MTRMSTKTAKSANVITNNKSALLKAVLTLGCLVNSLSPLIAGEWSPSVIESNPSSHKMPLADYVKPAGNLFDLKMEWDSVSHSYEHTAYAEPSMAEKLTYRYSDPTFVRFVNSADVNSTYGLYSEINRLIDERHVKPKPYDERVKKAVANLITAMDLPVFWKVNGRTPSKSNLESMKSMLNNILDEEAAHSLNQAHQVLNWVVSNASDRVGLKPQLTVLEFVYGAVESMDRFSGITLPNIATGEPRVGLEENVVGIGVEIETVDEGVQVLKVLKGGPAMDAGLKKGDIVRKIDGSSIAGMPISEVAGLIVGRAGTRLNVELVRDGSSMTRTMTRRSVAIPNVSEATMIDPIGKVGYFKLERFAESSRKELEDAMWTLYRQNMASMILDLRGNPGGLLTSAISISDMFVPCGTIVSTKGRNTVDNSMTSATFARTWNLPLVVLVDNNSASASEIVAAAIQENGRGVIVGTKSYGKGTVQSHFDLRSMNATVRLTTANFYAPSGRVMADAGVTPDVMVNDSSADASNATDDAALARAIEIVKGNKAAQLASSANKCNAKLSYKELGV